MNFRLLAVLVGSFISGLTTASLIRHHLEPNGSVESDVRGNAEVNRFYSNYFQVSDKTYGKLATEKLYNVRIVYGTNQWFNWSNTVVHVTFEDGAIIMDWTSAGEPYGLIVTPIK